MYNNGLDWWINSDPFTKDELEIIRKERSTEIITSKNFNKLADKFFNKIPYNKLSTKTHEISFAIHATTLIQLLFKKYVDDDTLVICTDGEHNSAKSCIEKSKNVFYLSYNKDILQDSKQSIKKIIEESKKYKKVFVYIIGTQISNGVITPQLFFENLKKAFVEHNIQHILTIDDVHGMFLVPRDYSIFDYIIYTAHVLTLHYDMGICINKLGLTRVGYKIYNWLEDYIKNLDIILKRSTKLYTFKPILFEVFSRFLVFKNFHMPEYGSPQIFSPYFICDDKTKNEMLKKNMKQYNISLELCEDNKVLIRNRIGEMIIYTQEDVLKYLKGLDILYNYLTELEGES